MIINDPPTSQQCIGWSAAKIQDHMSNDGLQDTCVIVPTPLLHFHSFTTRSLAFVCTSRTVWVPLCLSSIDQARQPPVGRGKAQVVMKHTFTLTYEVHPIYMKHSRGRFRALAFQDGTVKSEREQSMSCFTFTSLIVATGLGHATASPTIVVDRAWSGIITPSQLSTSHPVRPRSDSAATAKSPTGSSACAASCQASDHAWPGPRPPLYARNLVGHHCELSMA